MDNPERLAKMLEQQQAMKFLQSMQSGMASGYQGAMGEAERGQMMQGPVSDLDAQLLNGQPAPMYGQPMQQGDFSQQPVPMLGAPMQQQGQFGGRSAPMPTVGGMGQGAMSNKDLEMMRRMPK
jgi:hypothetical protein